MNLHRFLLLLAACCCCCCAGWLGCGTAKPPTKPETSEQTVVSPSDKTNSAGAATGTGADKPAKPAEIEGNSAAAAVIRTLKSLEAGHLAEAYDFLPPSCQSDIDGLVHDFAERMDAEVWTRLTGTVRKAIEILKTRKDFILALDLLRDRPEAEPYRKHWDSTLQLLTTLTDNEALDLSKLKRVSARSLLPGKGSASLPGFDAIGLALGANLSRQFAGVTVTSLRSEGAEQIVAIRGPKDDKPLEVVYVQHDGKWLPKSLVDQWNAGIAADRAWLEKLPDRIKLVKPRLLEALSQTDEILNQLLSAGDREQFEQAAGPAILALATAWPNMLSLARQTMAGQSEFPHVTITINRELTESELSQLTAHILKPLRESGSDYTLLANDGRTVCRLSRINDIASLRQSLSTHFAIPAEAVQLDHDAATIKLDLAP